MKHILLCAFVFASFEAFADVGPINLGSVSIGMSKAKYVSATGIAPVNCNTFRDSEGKLRRSEMKDLTSEEKTLCRWDAFDETGSIENIQVGGLSYDVISAKEESSESIKAFGWRSIAIFFNDRLISLKIMRPNVSFETLTTKYGAPKFDDNRRIKICKNRIGNEFKNNEGELDAVWTNGEVRSILRTIKFSPSSNCTDGDSVQHYILEEPKQLELIENAIDKYREDISKESAKRVAKDSPF